MKNKIVKVQAKVMDVHHDLMSNSVLVSLDINGIRRAIEIRQEQVIKFETTQTKSNEIMREYANAWKNRKLPVQLELTEEQLTGEGAIDVSPLDLIRK
jgi:hypothetical protein